MKKRPPTNVLGLIEMGSATYNLIREAILKGCVVTGWYDGRYREVCPHTIGLTGGREKFFAYQFGGASSKGLQSLGSEENWRCFFVAKFKVDQIRFGPWRTTEEGARNQKCVDIVDVEFRC